MIHATRGGSGKYIARHGMSKTPEHKAWSDMIKRCGHAAHPKYPRYGGRGITVCADWLIFENFLRDMGSRPSSDMSLDRIDNDAGYSKSNCRWATRRQQRANQAFFRLIEFNGESHCITEWARRLGVAPRTLGERMDKLGWSVERTLTTPIRPKARP